MFRPMPPELCVTFEGVMDIVVEEASAFSDHITLNKVLLTTGRWKVFAFMCFRNPAMCTEQLPM